MELALDAIVRAGETATPEEIRDELFATKDRQDSLLGTYSIDDKGDTSLIDYNISRVYDGALGRPQPLLGDKRELRRVTDFLQRRARAALPP